MTAGDNLRDRILTLAMLVTVFVLMLLVQLVNPPSTGLWIQTFANSLHVPVFGVIALCIFMVAGRFGNLGLVRRSCLAIGVAILLGVLSEALQIPGPRHASIEDLLLDWLGAAGVVLIAAAFAGDRTGNGWLRALSAACGVSLLVAALWPLIGISAAYLERNSAVPNIVNFDSRFGRRFILMQHAQLQISPTSNGKLAEITLQDGPWPGIILHDVWPDWTGYSSLVIELGMQDVAVLDINIRVHDRRHRKGDQAHNDRFNLEYALHPGTHTLRIPLDRIRQAPAGREMDMSRIDGVVIYCSATNAGRRFRLRSIRLE